MTTGDDTNAGASPATACRIIATGLGHAPSGGTVNVAAGTYEVAETFAEIQERHAAFGEAFNTTLHWAYRERADGLRTPATVLAWVRGRPIETEDLHRALRHLQLQRIVDPVGYVSIQQFSLYAERGLARRVSI